MNPDRDIFIKTIFIVSIILSFIGFFMSFNNRDGADILIITGLISTLIFLGIAIYEILNSSLLSKSEKIMWTIGIIVLSSVGGLIYLLFLRKRIDPPIKNN
jgi:hypothetical protein